MEISNRIAIGINYPVGEPELEPVVLADNSVANILVASEWEDVRYEIDLTLMDTDSNTIGEQELTFAAQRQQESITVTTDIYGKANIASIIPYDTPYEVVIGEESQYILVDNNEGTRYMDIDIYVGLGNLENTKNMNTVIAGVEWEAI